MAQTRRKRRTTKHRGNAAGMIESRGRTGKRPVTPEGRKGGGRGGARSRREDRFNRPPEWRGAVNRAVIAALFFGVVAVLILDRTVPQAAVLAAFMLLIYIPMGYYTDLFIYRRRQRRPRSR
jgi:hypothetical protein